MKGHENGSSQEWSGVSKLTPEIIELFGHTQKQSFEEGLEELQRDNSRLVREVIIQAEIHSNTISEKRASIEGALFMVALNRFAEQYENFQAAMRDDDPTDDDDGGALRPSA